MQYFTRVLRFHPSQNDQEQMDDLADFGQHTYLICKMAFKASSVLYSAPGVTAGCTVLHYVTPAANFYPSALPRFWRNHLFIRHVGHPVETAGTLHLTSEQSQPILLFNNKRRKSYLLIFFAEDE